MTSRDWPGPDNGTPSGKSAGAEGGAIPVAAPCGPPSVSLWEAWYTAASPAQREQLLEQARQQGLLFAHQLPAPERVKSNSRPGLFLAEHLAKGGPGSPRDLPPLAEPPFEPLDRDLDEGQRQAVARALATPDVALVLGHAGTGKSRVVAEVSRQALARGWRVLLAAADAPAVDRVIEQLQESIPGEKLLRWLGEQESLAPLASAAASLTLAGRLHHYQERTLAAARRTAGEAQARVEHSRQQAELWGQLEALAQETSRLEQARSALEAEGANLAAVVAAQWNGPGANGPSQEARELATIQERLTALRGEKERLEAEHRHCCEQREHLAPLVEAKETHRWWTGAWWRATVAQLATAAPGPRLEELAARCQKVDETRQALHLELADLEARAAELQQRLDHEREQYVGAETARRRADLDARLGEVSRDRQTAAASWQSALDRLERKPTDFTPASLAQGKADETTSLTKAQEEARLRHDWLAVLETPSPATLTAEWVANARLVGSTLTGLPTGPSSTFTGFDIVMLDEAHRASDADLQALAERGARLVLVGDVEPDLPIAPPTRPRSASSRRDRPGSDPDVAARPALPPPPFYRLWGALHADPRRLPGRCKQVNGRLVITMHPLPAEQLGWVQREQVFDRPEIELVISAAPGAEPSVIEVAFPGGTPIADAKAFLHRELQELAVHANGLQPRWRESETAWLLDLSLDSEGECAVVPIEEGVREHIGRCTCQTGSGEISWQTLFLEFDKAAGWDRGRAEAWVEERLRLRDAGRTSVLAKGYRFRPGLARFLSTMLHGGSLQPVWEAAPSDPWFANQPAVQFFPVPAQPRGGAEPSSHGSQPGARRGSDPALRWNGSAPGTATATMTTPARGQPRPARGGAGLEVDLVDPRRIDALPAELRPLLPGRGVVNYLEARAVLQALEELVADAEFQAACVGWRAEKGPAVAVVSLFPGQAELLRVLVQRSSVLAGSRVAVEVCQPRALGQREALVVMLSLTRSHATRAVPFSEHPRDLMLALTRAAGRLLIFGDPGTMNRRSQWFGALDHLDETTGPLEQALMGQMLASLPEHEATAPQTRAYAGKQ